MRPIPMQESSAAIADANGRAVCTLQPLQAFERWVVRLLTVQSTSETLEPTVRVYRGSETPNRLVGSTYSGRLDSSNEDLSIGNGERLMAVFSGCDVGARCVFSAEGEKHRGI